MDVFSGWARVAGIGLTTISRTHISSNGSNAGYGSRGQIIPVCFCSLYLSSLPEARDALSSDQLEGSLVYPEGIDWFSSLIFFN